MTITQRQIAARQSASEYGAVQQYCQGADMRLSRDPQSGYWLHYDGRMQFVRLLSDVRGWVDYLNADYEYELA